MPDQIARLDPEAVAAEFDCLMRRAGIEIPADRRQAILAGYGDLRGQIALLHGARPASAEPANVFRLPHPVHR